MTEERHTFVEWITGEPDQDVWYYYTDILGLRKRMRFDEDEIIDEFYPPLRPITLLCLPPSS